MGANLVQLRRASPADAEAVAAIHENAWRSTYQGVIPHLHLERMIARRDAGWWQRHLQRSAVTVLTFDGQTQGYTSFGPARGDWPGGAGEIFELYLAPVFQGVGLGRTLFQYARARLRERRLYFLIVWALEANEQACAFYSHLGGKISLTAPERYGKVTLQRLAYTWKA
jgi:GNAT superfamily N-acetyltransferase